MVVPLSRWLLDFGKDADQNIKVSSMHKQEFDAAHKFCE